MVSEEGLDAYGAVTWGQFFVYQGFNPHVGWMHTSSGVSALSEYLETVEKKADSYYYKYGDKELPVTTGQISVPYLTEHGMAEKKFTVYRTQHGPVIGEQDGKWVTVRLMQEPVKALIQSYTRTKATDYKSFRQTMELHTNSSNNTIYADADGDIAYFHGNFIPRRDTRFDWTKPVEGSDPATDWHGLLSVDETPHLLNPQSGWIYNSNDAPWSAAGPGSLKKEDFPVYVETGGESARGLHAVKVFEGKKDFTLDSLIGAAFDSYLPWFERAMPALIKAWDQDQDSDLLKAKLAEQIQLLRSWDYRWGVDSVPTSLAVFWGEDISRRVAGEARRAGLPVYDYVGSKATRRAAPAIARGGLPEADSRLRNLENALGGDQPLPAPHRRYRSALRRLETQHSRRVHFCPVGVAGVLRGAPLRRNEEVVRKQREQFRRGG